MCGIAGVVRFDGQPVAPTALTQSCRRMRHRGPDHTGLAIHPGNPSNGLAAVRLAVIDPSPACNQPATGGDGRYTLVFNGAVYNFRELRHELLALGDRFRTDGDTEVIAAACARWGAEALRRFNGMWALAFCDHEARRGFVARDRFGIKPLVYSPGRSRFTFASELAALRELDDFDETIDDDALTEHLVFGFVSAPRTIERGARRLPPGHLIHFDERGASEPTRYYHLPAASGDTMPYAEACRRVRHLLGEAVVRRCVADVPLGAFLSGGLDSTIVVSHLAAARGSAIDTFSLGFRGQQAFDETDYARIAARRFGTNHHELRLSLDDLAAELPALLDHLPEPVGDSSILPTALVSRLARQWVTVALSGDAGDELFGGYWRYLGHRALAAYLRWPALLCRPFEPLLRRLGSGRSSALRQRARQYQKLIRTASDSAIARHFAWSRILSPEHDDLFRDTRVVGALQTETVEAARAIASNSRSRSDELADVLLVDLHHQLPSDMLAKVDLASMRHSLEVRVPFLDPELVEWAATLPSSYKVLRGMRKRILVDAYRGHVPDEILDRPKRGFEAPIGELLRGPSRSLYRDTVTREVVESFPLLSYSGLRRLESEHEQRAADHGDVLFAMLSLCWWRRSQWRAG